jgi:hypothetical protein
MEQTQSLPYLVLPYLGGPPLSSVWLRCPFVRLVRTGLRKVSMETIGAFEAKTHLAALLDPVPGAAARLTHQEIVEGMRELRLRVKPGKMTVRELIQEGRRY